MEITQNINKKALKVAIVSFLLGSFILAFYLISASESFLIAGVFFAFIALVLNTITFIELITNAIINYQHYRENITTILFFLINIPVAVGYFILATNNSF